MSALALDARYAGASTAAPSGLRLVADHRPADSPFLEGRLIDPRPFAQLMVALGDVVHARHHVPAAMLTRILAEADPVVTVGGGIVRFEGFSACCSAYARVDLLPGGLDTSSSSHGTTNVDFSAALRAALHGLRFEDGAALAVSPRALTLGDVVERKIALPVRWIRGFLQVSSLLSRLVPAGTWPAPVAARFLASLPRDAAFKAPTWLVPSGAALRLSTRAAPDALRLSGPSRIRALEPTLRAARALSAWRDPADQASAWVVDAGTARITLLLSADPWRGLSGEGQGLLAIADPPPGVARARAALRWQAVLDETALDGHAPALAALGHLGFDLVDRAWFHRELPWRPERLETLLPRLRAARDTVAGGAVRFDGPSVAWVRGSQGEHRVDLGSDPPRCTCTWHARTQGVQGPCRHVLAAQLAVPAQSA